MIEYQEYLGGVRVLLDGKRVGVIQAVDGGWQYQPNGSALTGDVYPTLAAVKRSLVEDDA